MSAPPEDPRLACAWWCAVAEPGDAHASALRAALGDPAAIEWALRPEPGPLPDGLARDGRGGSRRFEEAWARWNPRALVADPLGDLEALERLGGRIVIPQDVEWPASLDDLGGLRPHALWALGAPVGGGDAVAVVGSRAATDYGEHVAADMGLELAEQGIDVVSGGAFGIDSAAHRGALAARGGRTRAVMAGGLGRLYPAAHADLYDRMVAAGGTILSEVPPSWRPAKWRFIGRNRVIAAMGSATVVVEASERSGALSTARRAMELGRHVGAVPGPVTSGSSHGCHLLLRQGAALVRDARDVMELISSFALIGQEPVPGAPVTGDRGSDALPTGQRRVWEALPARRATSVDRLIRASGMSQRDVLSALGRLEVEGWVESGPSGWARLPGHGAYHGRHDDVT